MNLVIGDIARYKNAFSKKMPAEKIHFSSTVQHNF